MSDEQIKAELDFIKENFKNLDDRAKRSVWANLSELCEKIAIEKAKKVK